MGGKGERVGKFRYYTGQQIEWLEEGTLIHETSSYPPRIWRATDVIIGAYKGRTSCDAICFFTGERLQGYEFEPGADLPAGWVVVENEMELLARASLTREQWEAGILSRKKTT